MGTKRCSVVPPTIRLQIVQQLAGMRKYYLVYKYDHFLKIKRFESQEYNEGVKYNIE